MRSAEGRMREVRGWLAVVGTAVALAVVSVAVGLSSPFLTRLDAWVASHAFDATHGHDGRVAVWTAVSDVGGPTSMRLLLLVVGVLLIVGRRPSPGAWLVVLAVLEGVVAPLSKHILERPRPAWKDPITVISSTSYPSGHATAAATAAVALALLARRTAMTWVCVVTAVAVAASRVFLGVHYLSDVLGGILLGAFLASMTYAVMSAVVRRADGRSRSQAVSPES